MVPVGLMAELCIDVECRILLGFNRARIIVFKCCKYELKLMGYAEVWGPYATRIYLAWFQS